MSWNRLVLAALVLASPAAALDNGLARTPPMGWNSWNKFHCAIDENLIRQTADAMVSSGLRDAGYVYLGIDDCWAASTRDASGNLRADTSKFPSGMKAIGDYIHARGLKYGIYASIGTATCTALFPGSLNNESRDVATFASWGVDQIKADRCHADTLDYPAIYRRWRDAIAASGRPMVLSMSVHGRSGPWAWGPATGHYWRTTGDIDPVWTEVLKNMDGTAPHAGATQPGGFNDPDMLEVGNGMTTTEDRAHMGMWALFAAPLLAGNDVRSMSATSRDILTHSEVIDVNQDVLGYQAVKVRDNGAGLQVWAKPLSGAGNRAVGLLNRSAASATMSVTWSEIGLGGGSATVRDLWARTTRGTFTGSYSVSVPSHGLALLRISGQDLVVSTGYVSDQSWVHAANEISAVQRNRSNGGNTITLGGTTYTKGLGVHAPSAVELRPGGACSTFTAQVGVDDEVGSAGNVIFQIWADGTKLYDSGVMTGATATRSVNVGITGRTAVRLQVNGGTDGTTSDHADWADARVTCGGTPTITPTPTPTPTPVPGGTLSGYYRMMARHSGKAVVVQSASTADGADVIQWAYGGSNTNDEWLFTSLGGGYYRIDARHSGKAMVVQAASTADGADVIQWTYGGSNTNDEWQVVDLGTGYYRVNNRNGGKAVEVIGGGTADGADVVQRTYSGATHQQFQIIAVP